MTAQAEETIPDESGTFVENWYGFGKPPFHVTPDSTMVFSHRRYEEALSALQYGVMNGKGFVVITGEIGAGKTTLLRHFVNLLGDDVCSAVILNTGLDSTGLLGSVAEDLKIIKHSSDLSGKELLDAIGNFLFDQFKKQQPVAILIDEAQNLSVEALESIRMLSNLETENEKLVQIVLFGQPDLQKKLAQPELLQLRTRIAVTYHLCPMELEETSAYISHRLAHAEPSRPVSFSERAVRKLHRYTNGSPRLINILCDQALLAGGAQQSETIDADIIESVIEGFDHLDNPRRKRSRWFLVPLFAAMIAAIAAGAYRYYPRFLPPAEPQQQEVPVAPQQPALQKRAPLSDLIASYGLPANSNFEQMTVPAIAAATGLISYEVRVTAQTAETLGLPAILMPNNPVIINFYPVIITNVKDGVWTAETRDQGTITFPFNSSSLPLFYLLPRKPYMTRTMKRGQHGEDVKAVQQILEKAGLFPSSRSGRFEQGTVGAVRRLQNRYQITGDGVIGPETMIAIYALEKSLELH